MSQPLLHAQPPTSFRRAWFQLHLSTCVVLMFVAGLLVFLNINLAKGGVYSLNCEPLIGFPFPFLLNHGKWGEPFMDWGSLILDVFFMLGWLGYVASVCERLIARKRPNG